MVMPAQPADPKDCCLIVPSREGRALIADEWQRRFLWTTWQTELTYDEACDMACEFNRNHGPNWPKAQILKTERRFSLAGTWTYRPGW